MAASRGILQRMLISHDSNRDSLFHALPTFQSAWPAGGWSWDNRFECIASTIAQGVSAKGWSVAIALFPHVWEERNLSNAPPAVAKVAAATGGVRRGQFLLSTEAVDGLLMFGLWWPWGDEGSNISMRLGFTGNATRDETLRFRNLFKVRDD